LAVLLADDGRASQVVARRFLERRGHRVTLAVNGREALAEFERSRFDAILMDIDMPEMNGYEATRAIREAERGGGRRIPIIALTSNALQSDREACLAAGMDGHLAKPVQADVLCETLERFAMPTETESGN
jgi:CheY-like chemotaxis protein